MKKKVIDLVIAVAAVVLLVLLLLWAQSAPADTSSSEDNLVAISDRDSSEVSEVQVKNSFGEYHLTVDEEGVYSLDQLEDFDLSANTISPLFSAAAAFSGEQLFDQTPEDLAEYGLEEPSATLTFTYTDGSTITVQLGDQSPSGYYYFVTDSRPGLYLDNLEYLSDFLVPATELLSKTVVAPLEDVSVLEMTQVTLMGGGREEPTVITYEPADEEDENSEDRFVQTAPYRLELKDTVAFSALKSLFGISGQTVEAVNPTQEELAEFGLLDPYMTAVVENENGGFTLHLSEPQDGYAYLYREGQNLVFRVSTSGFEWITLTGEDLLSPFVFDGEETDYASFSFSGNGSTYDLQLTQDEEGNQSGTCNGSEISSEELTALFDELFGLRRDQYDLQSSDDGQVLLTISCTYTQEDRQADEIVIRSGEPRRAVAYLNGRATAVINTTQVDDLLDLLAQLAA